MLCQPLFALWKYEVRTCLDHGVIFICRRVGSRTSFLFHFTRVIFCESRVAAISKTQVGSGLWFCSEHHNPIHRQRDRGTKEQTKIINRRNILGPPIHIMGNSISLEEELINLRMVSKQMQRSSKKCEKNEKSAVDKLKKVRVVLISGRMNVAQISQFKVK